MDGPTIREHLEVKAIAEKAGDRAQMAVDATTRLAETVQAFVDATAERHREHERALLKEIKDRDDSVRRVHRRIDDDRKDAEEAERLKDAEREKKIRELQDYKLVTKAWIAGAICTGTALGGTIGYLLSRLFEGKPPPPIPGVTH